MNGGTSVPLTMVVTVNSPAFDGDSIDNSATVSADNGQGGSYTSPSNIVSYPIVAAPIIAAVKSAVPASGSTVSPGNTITYTVVVTNSGNANTSTAILHDAIPAGTTYVAGSTTLNGNTVVELTPGVAPAAGNISVSLLRWRRSGRGRRTLAHKRTASARLHHQCAQPSLQVSVNSGFTGTITNVATAGTASTPDVNSNQTTHISGADLTIAKTVNNPTPGVGTNVTFTVTVQNIGPGDAAGVSVADALPSGYAFVSATPSVGSYNSSTGVWTIGALANGGSATLTITATVLACGNYTNTATATSTTFDPTTPNTASASTTPAAPMADVVMAKTVSNTLPNVGSNVTFTLTVSNNGPSVASGVVVNDLLPSGCLCRRRRR
jgi:uncharacterized repeat protein (TIGR01451 family)